MDAQFIIQILLGVVGVLVTVIGAWIGINIERLTDSVQSLNLKMEGVLIKVDSHEKRIVSLETRR